MWAAFVDELRRGLRLALLVTPLTVVAFSAVESDHVAAETETAPVERAHIGEHAVTVKTVASDTETHVTGTTADLASSTAATTNGISGLLVGVAVVAVVLWRRWQR